MNKLLKSYPLYHGSETSKQGKAPLNCTAQHSPGIYTVFLRIAGVPGQYRTGIQSCCTNPQRQTTNSGDRCTYYVRPYSSQDLHHVTDTDTDKTGWKNLNAGMLRVSSCRIGQKKFSFICEFFRYYFLTL